MSETNVSEIYNNLPDNSHKGREDKKQLPAEEKRVEKVVQGKVKTKKNNARKLADVFVHEDMANVKNYVIYDVVVPFLKKALYESVTGAFDMILFGGRGGGDRKRSRADRVSYTDYSSSSRRDDHSYSRNRTNSGYSYDDLVFETRGEAEAVLSRMDEIMEEYDFVRVADMYDLAGMTGEYTDNKYGWTNIRNAKVVRVRDGYMIEMPRALPLK